MIFKGWPDTALAFYAGLEADNSKTYWLNHKDVYEQDVKAPMEALLAELTKQFGEEAARSQRPRLSTHEDPNRRDPSLPTGSIVSERSSSGGLPPR
jgi:uncharacterized protein (DUF2461 family)